MDAVLPTGYYLDNFFKILDFVDDQYADLLVEPERELSRTFRGLELHAQRLYVRLISRKGPHFRTDKLSYPEIDLPRAQAGLIEAGLLDLNRPIAPEELLPLMLRPELTALAKTIPQILKPERPIHTLKKPELMVWIAGSVEAESLRAGISKITHWLTPLFLEALDVYRLLFFGNLGQDLTEFVVSDLGLVRYENYEIAKEDRLFQSRAVLDDTLAYIALSQAVGEALETEADEWLAGVPDRLPSSHGLRGLERRRDRMLNRVGRYFERRRDDETALRIYAAAMRPPARERGARILARGEKFREALALCEDILADPYEECEEAFAAKFANGLRKKLELPRQPRHRIAHPTETLSLRPDPGKRIEDLVLDHLQAEGLDGFYAENRFWLDLFGLTFWDIVFMPVRGAFFNRYQRGPKGLFSADFRREREHAIAARLRQVSEDPDWPQTVLDRYEAKHGIANRFVNWQLSEPANLERVMRLAPRRHLAAILDRLSRNPGELKSGFPDLVLFPAEPPGVVLAEVKGPGDQLQPNQKRWLRFFHERGIPYRVLKVIWNRQP